MSLGIGSECEAKFSCGVLKKTDSNFNDMMFNKISEYRTPLMGVAMICVFMFHSVGDWMPHGVYNILKHGDIGVDVFLFLSAVGLTYSITKNPNFIAFYKRRALRIMPSYWLIMTCVYLFVYAMVTMHVMPENYYWMPHSVWQIVQAYTTVGYWMNGIFYLWYVPAILGLYLLFPFVHYAFVSCRWTYVLALAPAAIIAFCPPNLEWYHNCLLYRVGIFFWGGIFAVEFLQKDRRIGKAAVYAAGLLFLLFYVVRMWYGLPQLGNRIVEESMFFIALPCILVCLTSMFRFRCIEMSMAVVGKVSLEFYLIHEFVMRLMLTFSNVVVTMPPLVQKVVTFFVSLALAYIANNVVDFMTKRLFVNKNNSR